ncbi:hypothetical protein ES705_01923 [subsurface metagenome]|nr:hypothetical protein [Clostridia bacterium]
MNQGKKPDEIYCPSCAKPIKKDAVVCPHCGVQIKELKVPPVVKLLTPEEEQAEGRNQLGGIKIFCWLVILVLAICSIVFILVSTLLILVEEAYYVADAIVPPIIILIFIFGPSMALYIIPLIGIIKRRPYSVPFTRAMLIITMFGFPIGTIIGISLWRRINHPLARKYLNYGI